MPNRLAAAASPYLRQHAENPVDWYPWGTEALDRARREDKPIIVSIGYSACHWCHVMERESFENAQVAEVMNREFVCVKVDREERPDVDHLYMEAVQATGAQGGWPLNAFLLPDQRPFYGVTYLPPQEWYQLTQQIAHAFKTRRTEITTSAGELTRALRAAELEKYGITPPETTAVFDLKTLHAAYQRMARGFDPERGGPNRAPKFPMPVIYQLLLRYHHLTDEPGALDHVRRTLLNMARGGIYDQLGGGFARYSVDADWFAPHFEKMLYDQGQLLSLYADAWLVTKEPEFRRVAEQTIAFVNRELMQSEG
ncbi:MAG: DUF255 domain-containing protein, partial [Catalinimonas sp.]